CSCSSPSGTCGPATSPPATASRPPHGAPLAAASHQDVRRAGGGARRHPGGARRRADVPPRSLRVRQDDHAAHDRRLCPSRRRRHPDQRSERGGPPSRAAADGDGLPAVQPLAPHDRGREHRVRAQAPPPAAGSDRGAGPGRPRPRRAPGVFPEVSPSTVGRGAAARRGGPGARAGAPDPPPRRALQQPGRAPPGAHARGSQAAPAQGRDHHGVRHPRSGGGPHDRGPDRGHERGSPPAGRYPGRAVRPPPDPLRGRLHRHDEPRFRPRRRRPRARGGAVAPRAARRAVARGRRGDARRPAGGSRPGPPGRPGKGPAGHQPGTLPAGAPRRSRGAGPADVYRERRLVLRGAGGPAPDRPRAGLLRARGGRDRRADASLGGSPHRPRVIPGSPSAGPVRLRAQEVFEHAFTLAAPGEAWAALTLDAPGTSWRRGEAAVVAVDVDGGARQEVILAGGDEPTEYPRALGRLPAGLHTLRLRIPQDLPLSAGRAVTVGPVRTGSVDDSDPAASVWRHAPVIHYRALHGPLDSLTSDAPLVLFYRMESRAGGASLEYHVIYSHEDAGTDLTGLLAAWGHTVDIEWVFRVTLDPHGRVIGEEFQGPEHATLRFGGGRTMGGHPVLQVATLNGNVTDVVRCPYRA